MDTEDRTPIFREERHVRILQLLDQEHRVVVPDLAARLNVSEDTIRRDLRDLQAKNLVRKTHGGALRHTAPPVSFENRVGVELDLKTAIGTRAAELAQEGDSIFIDGATTALAVARALRVSSARILTNSLEVARIIAARPQLELIVLGGKWDPVHHQLVGAVTVEQVRRYRVDKFFVGIGALNRRDGLTEPTEEDAAVKRAMIESAQQVIGLADHSKLGRVCFACVAPASAIDVLVTDDLADCTAFSDLKWEIIRARGESAEDGANSFAAEPPPE